MFHFAAAAQFVALTGAGVSTLLLGFRRLWRRRVVCDRWSINPDIAHLQSELGYSEHSFIASAVQSRAWLDPEGKGAVSYTESGRVWVVGGGPLARLEDLKGVADRFIAEARKRRKIVSFLPTTERFAQAMKGSDVRIVKVGACPYFDLKAWDPHGNSAKKLRLGVNRARRAEVTVDEVRNLDEHFRAEVAELGREWNQSRRAGVTFGWLFDVIPFQDVAAKRYFAARTRDGRLVGLLMASPIPARDGWYLEDVLRSPTAPDGISDLLVFEALRALAAGGARLATLGTVPLSPKGSDAISVGHNWLVERSFRWSRRLFRNIYNFEGLGAFKSKFVPSWWENEYVVITRGHVIPPRVANAVFNVLLPGGLLQILQILLSSDKT